MRSIILFLLAIGVISLGFGIYWVMLGSDEIATLDVGGGSGGPLRVAATLPTTSPTLIGEGKKPYYARYDPNTGQLTSRLRAQLYQPQPDGRWLVERPEAEFFLDGGRVVRIVGKTGVITMEEIASEDDGDLSRGVTRSPRSGSLYDVTLTLLPGINQPAELTMTMQNASFDNENALIYTAGYTEGGKSIPGDMVPIRMRGEEYEFDGRGLRLQYGELSRRLEYLKVVYGERLLIRHPAQFMRGAKASQAEKAGELKQGFWRPTVPLAGVMLAAADSRAAVEAVRLSGRRQRRASPPTTGKSAVEEAEEQPVYRARFEQDVEIFQGGRKLASAGEMIIDYLTEERGGLSMIGSSTTRPAAAVGTSARPRAVRREGADETPAGGARRGRRRTDADSQDEPIEIRWKGPLTIVPLDGDWPAHIAPGESIVRLVGVNGRRVEVTRTGDQVTSQIQCATMTYWSIDGRVLLEDAPGIAVELRDSRGTAITTGSLSFSQATGVALLSGKSHATLPLAEGGGPAEKAGAKQELMDVDWTDRCTLHLQGDRLEEMVMSRIDLWGNVSIKHPQLKMQSENLQLRFASQDATVAETRPARRSLPPLEQVDASGWVRCEMVGPGGESDVRQVNCDNLKLLTARTAEGRLYARNIIAIGHVQAVDSDRELQAGYVHLTLGQPNAKSTTRPAGAGRDVLPGELESLVAHDNVRVKTVDGKSAKASQLTIEVKEGVLSATLHGEVAEVTDGQNTLAGPIIYMVPDREQLTVTGEGRLTGLVQKGGDKPARPVSVSWKKSLRADGRENLIECFGAVEAKTTGPSGEVTTTKGERVRIVTTERATTQPADRAVAEASTTRPSEFEMLGDDREIRSIAMEENAQVLSELMDGNGQLLRRFYVTSAAIYYEREAKRLSIPQAGQMLFVDNRSPATQPAAQEAAKDPFGIRGQTAFGWSESLVYDEGASRITMLGNATVVRNAQAGEPDEKVELKGDRIVAELEPISEDEAKAAGEDELSVRVQFKRVTAQGNVSVASKDLNVTAEMIEYDPVKHYLTVRGTERAPAAEWDANGLKVAEFDELVWDTAKSQVISRRLRIAPRSGSRAFGAEGLQK